MKKNWVYCKNEACESCWYMIKKELKIKDVGI